MTVCPLAKMIVSHLLDLVALGTSRQSLERISETSTGTTWEDNENGAFIVSFEKAVRDRR